MLGGEYLTIRLVARKGYGSIAHEAKPNGLLIRNNKGNNKVRKCKLKKYFLGENPANFATR